MNQDDDRYPETERWDEEGVGAIVVPILLWVGGLLVAACLWGLSWYL